MVISVNLCTFKEIAFITIRKELLDELLQHYQGPGDFIGENSLLKQLTKASVERTMEVELACHLGYEKHSPASLNSSNSRNDKSQKTIKGNYRKVTLDIPRDRNRNFTPKIIPKGQTRFD